jgi:hypothetical protein
MSSTLDLKRSVNRLNESESENKTLRDFEVYKANKEDETWTTDYYRKKSASISLIVSRTALKKQSID